MWSSERRQRSVQRRRTCRERPVRRRRHVRARGLAAPARQHRCRSAAPGGRATRPATASSCAPPMDRDFVLEGGGQPARHHGRLRDLGRARRRRRPTRSSCATPSPATATPPGRPGPGHPDAGLVGRADRPGPGRSTPTAGSSCASNVLGGCQGTTGPASPQPDRAGRYGSRFPVVTDPRHGAGAGPRWPTHLGIDRWASVRRRLDGRHAGARVGRDVPRPGARRSCPIATCRGRDRAADRVLEHRPPGDRARPEVAQRRLLRRRARRRPARRPGRWPA